MVKALQDILVSVGYEELFRVPMDNEYLDDDEPMTISISVPEIIEMMEYADEIEEQGLSFSVDQFDAPYYGFDEFDDGAFDERLKEEMHELGLEGLIK